MNNLINDVITLKSDNIKEYYDTSNETKNNSNETFKVRSNDEPPVLSVISNSFDDLLLCFILGISIIYIIDYIYNLGKKSY